MFHRFGSNGMEKALQSEKERKLVYMNEMWKDVRDIIIKGNFKESQSFPTSLLTNHNKYLESQEIKCGMQQIKRTFSLPNLHIWKLSSTPKVCSQMTLNFKFPFPISIYIYTHI